MVREDSEELTRAGQFGGVGHGPQGSAGRRHQPPEQRRVGGAEPVRVLRAGAGGGEEGPLAVHAGDQALGRQDLEYAERPHQLIFRGRDEAGQEAGGPVAVQEVHGRPAGPVVAGRESAARGAVAMEVDKPGKQGAAGRQRELLRTREMCGVKAVAGSRVGDQAAVHRHHAARCAVAVRDEGTPQDVGRGGGFAVLEGQDHAAKPSAARPSCCPGG